MVFTNADVNMLYLVSVLGSLAMVVLLVPRKGNGGSMVALRRRCFSWIVCGFVVVGMLIAGRILYGAGGVDDYWSINRLAPAMATVSGLNPYSTYDQGPQISWMYGPVAFLVYLPAACISHPRVSLLVACCISAIMLWLPLFFLLLRVQPHGTRGMPETAAAVFLVSVLYGLSSPLGEMTTGVLADTPAIALSMTAVAILCVAPKPLARWRICVAMLVACLAFWAKQTVLPILVILPLWVMFRQGKRAFLAATATVMASNVILALGFGALFGFGRLFFVMFVHPLNYGWQSSISRHRLSYEPLSGGFLAHARVLGEVFAECVLFALPLLIPLLMGAAVIRLCPTAGKQGKFAPSRDALATAWLCIVLSLSLLPMAMMARAKIGGDLNIHGVWLMFLLAACGLILPGAIAHLPRKWRWGRMRMASGGAFLLAFLALACILGRHAAVIAPAVLLVTMALIPRKILPGRHGRLQDGGWARWVGGVAIWAVALPVVVTLIQHRIMPGLQAFRASRLSRANAILQRHPGEIWFPQLPLAHLAVEARLHHTQYGLVDRAYGPRRVTQEHLMTGVPPRLEVIAFDDRFGGDAQLWSRLGGVQPEGQWTRCILQDLPGFICFIREHAAAPAAEAPPLPDDV